MNSRAILYNILIAFNFTTNWYFYFYSKELLSNKNIFSYQFSTNKCILITLEIWPNKWSCKSFSKIARSIN